MWLLVVVALTVAYTTTIVLSGLGFIISQDLQSINRLVSGEDIEVLRLTLLIFDIYTLSNYYTLAYTIPTKA